MLAEKDQEIANMDQEISRLRAEARKSKRTAEEKARVDAELKTTLADLTAEKNIRLEGSRIIMPNAALFSSGSVKINDDGKKVLDAISMVLAKYSSREILIEGHADNVPIAKNVQGKYKSNWELSSARALAVLHDFRTKPATKGSRLAAVAYGATRPVADNKTDEGKKKNRRVVIVVGGVM